MLLCVTRAVAVETISIAHSDPELDEVVDRLVTELSTDGYPVRRAEPSERSPCDRLSEPRPAAGAKGAWIVVARDASDPERVIASICFRSAVTVLQRVSAQGLRREPERFALTTAEALNGLSAAVPWVVPQPARPAETSGPLIPPARRSARGASNALTLATAAVVDAAGVPPLWGLELASTARIHANLAWQLAAFVPVTSAEIENASVSLRARTSWLRLGPSLHAELGAARAQVSLLAGPALTWASADARSPRVGTTDVALSSLVTLGAALQYPRESWLFVQGAAHLSALLPAVRLALAEDTSHALGPLLFDASFGVGLRWGRAPE
jgi:hypothetical protein